MMSALLDNGLEVTALHNHFFFESPRIFYMHVHGHGTRPIWPKGQARGRPDWPWRAAASNFGHWRASNVSAGQIDTAKIAIKLSGTKASRTASLQDHHRPRRSKLKEMGATINARMGLNTWAAFFGSDRTPKSQAMSRCFDEITPVLKALRSNGLNVVAMHNHMTSGQPAIYFLHYWGRDPPRSWLKDSRPRLTNSVPTGKPPQGESGRRRANRCFRVRTRECEERGGRGALQPPRRATRAALPGHRSRCCA